MSTDDRPPAWTFRNHWMSHTATHALMRPDRPALKYRGEVTTWAQLSDRSLRLAAALAARHPEAVGSLVLAGAIADPRARSPQAQFGRFLRDVPREPLLQAPILLRDVWDAGPGRVHRTLELATAHPIEADLRHVRCPTMILTGGRDPLAPPDWCATLGRILPAARVVTVPGVAHNVVTSAAAETAAAVRAFCRPTGTR